MPSPPLPPLSKENAAKIDFVVNIENDPSASPSSSTTATIAFGSCHKNKYSNPQIWKSIRNENPIAFLWTGDAIYPPIRNIASLPYLQQEYEQMQTNHSIGYTQMNDISTFGTWDDHDYGGNDRGNDMTQRMERAQLFYDFLHLPMPRDDVTSKNNAKELKEREGIYYSVEFRSPTTTANAHHDDKDVPITAASTVRILFLDTRYHRTAHCLPSLAGRFPLGAGMACLSRWYAAGMLQHYCTKQQQSNTTTLLGKTQWEWLRQQIYSLPPPDVLIVISSIQVYTTNPAMEGWGHFPQELQQLSELLLYASRRSVVTILSGDVHHGEILNPFPHMRNSSTGSHHHPHTDHPESTFIPPQPYYLEVTSSGLTHDCSKHIYGVVCEPLLRTFHQHRYPDINSYYIGKNYGTISIDWVNQNVSVNVHDAITGTIQLSTGPRSFIPSSIAVLSNNTTTANDDEMMNTTVLLNSILPCMDNHLVPYVNNGCILLFIIVAQTYMYFDRKRIARNKEKEKKS